MLAMKKWFLALSVSFCLSSCSYLTNFYIFNTTEEAITITYKAKNTEVYTPFVTAPKIFNFKNLKTIQEKELPNAFIKVKDSFTIVAILQPKQALWIGLDRSFILKNDRHKLKQNLNYVSITGNLPPKHYTAEEILPEFKEITYKIVGIEVE
tara:strand:- start:25486 stop:25941 length:456 start_codon:yes stop_codon:yes gene_type:complete